MDCKVLLKPAVTESQAVDLVRRLYGLNVTSIKRMVGFNDQNFHIMVFERHQNPHLLQISEHGYTLKITNTFRSAQEGYFDDIHCVMLHLTSKGLTVPVPVRNLTGDTWSKEDVPLLDSTDECSEKHDHEKLCGVQLLTFIPGSVVFSVDYSEDILYQWGLLLAKYHNAVKDLYHPTLMSKSILWDLENIPILENYLDGLEESKEKLVRRVLDKYTTEITPNINHLQKGFIHGDFNENNVLTDGHTVDGILDLEEVHYGTFVWDIGVMLAYAMLDCDRLDPLVGVGHTLAGYLSLRPLSDREMSLIKICIESRLCQSLVFCAHSYRKDPTNSYLLSTAKTGWTRLEQISNAPKEHLLTMWEDIRRGYQDKRA